MDMVPIRAITRETFEPYGVAVEFSPGNQEAFEVLV
jgi:ureidoglycolate hydrolase